MKTQQMVAELQEVARRRGFQVRSETGSFRGGRCTVGGEDLIVLNRLHPPEVHLAVLADSFRGLPLDSIFITPAVRRAVEQVWARGAEVDDSMIPDTE